MIGSYELDSDQWAWFEDNSFSDDGTAAEYIGDSFELNRDEYPNGGYWLFQMDEGLPKTLANQLAGLPRNEMGYTCLDHIIAYRKRPPFLPLLRYRYAFRGGCLELSGHYSKMAVKAFGDASDVVFSHMENPLITHWKKEGPL